MLQNLEFSRQTCEHKKYESKCASTNFNREYSQKNNPMKIFPLQCKIVQMFQSEPDRRSHRGRLLTAYYTTSSRGKEAKQEEKDWRTPSKHGDDVT